MHPFEIKIKNRRIEIVLDLLFDSLTDLFTDWKLFDCAFYHLMSNAVKYSPNNANIKVTIEKRPLMTENANLTALLVTTIKDYGDGYDPTHEIKNDYKTFTKPMDSKSEIIGVGIGHSTASTLSRSLGGELNIVSSDKQTFNTQCGTSASFSVVLTSKTGCDLFD